MLAHPDSLAAQLRAILATAAGTDLDLRVMLPMVESLEQVDLVRAMLLRAVAESRVARSKLGAMIETAAGVELAGDDLRLGGLPSASATNDLTHSVLGPIASPRRSALTHARESCGRSRDRRGRARGGDSERGLRRGGLQPDQQPAADRGGDRRLSVRPARVGTVRRWVRSLRTPTCAESRRRQREASTSGEVEVAPPTRGAGWSGLE